MKYIPSQLLRVSEAAKLVNCAPETIRKQVRENSLKHFRVGRDLRFDAAELLNHFRVAGSGQ